MDSSSCHPCEDSLTSLPCVTTNEEQAYPTTVPEMSRLMIDLPQSSDSSDDETSVNECEVDSKLKISDTKVDFSSKHVEEGVPISVKRKSGWPKGKKRKLVVDSHRVPKPPTTGYVMFLTEKRKLYKTNFPELAFAEVTKLLGSEWSNLCSSEKQKYLDKSDADKKRYREELHSYQQAELVRGKVEIAKPALAASAEQQEVTSDLEKAHDHEELYCDVCDQFFVSLHNKKEHFYGKQHLQAVTCTDDRHGMTTSYHIPPPNVNRSILDFIQVVIDREAEIKQLELQLVISKDSNGSLLRELGQLRILNSRMQSGLQKLKTEEACLKEQLHNLRMVPAKIADAEKNEGSRRG